MKLPLSSEITYQSLDVTKDVRLYPIFMYSKNADFPFSEFDM